jgi:hypothetical protein
MNKTAINKYERTDLVVLKKDGKDVEAEVKDVKREGGKYVYKLDKVDEFVPEAELKRAASAVSIVSGLKEIARELVAIEFPTQDAYDKYMKEHPDADRSKHKVEEKKEEPKKEESPKQLTPEQAEQHPFNLMRKRKNEEALKQIGKHYKKDPKDLTVDEITKYNQRKKASESTMEQDTSSSVTSKEEESMSRERITSRTAKSQEVLGALAALKKALTAADDAELTQWADELAKQEKEVVQKNTPDAELKDVGDQNAKANANWPLSEQEKIMVASKLVKLAKELVK